jgi:site-specific DNA-methyltransferase (adenine-specific)
VTTILTGTRAPSPPNGTLAVPPSPVSGGKIKPYYKDESITIVHGMCQDVLPLLPDKSVDLVLTDPPYDWESHQMGRRVAKNQKKGSRSTRGDMLVKQIEFEGLDEETRRWFGSEAARLGRGWIMIFSQIEGSQFWRWSVLGNDIGDLEDRWGKEGWGRTVEYARTQLWIKKDPTPQFTGDRPGVGSETIVTLWGGAGERGSKVGLMGKYWRRKVWNGKGTAGIYKESPVPESRDVHFLDFRARAEQDGLFYIGNGVFEELKGGKLRQTAHDTEKPLPLIRKFITLFSNPGDLIIDPFLGSGTTAVAAKELGRRCIGIEREEKWCELAANRVRGVRSFES